MQAHVRTDTWQVPRGLKCHSNECSGCAQQGRSKHTGLISLGDRAAAAFSPEGVIHFCRGPTPGGAGRGRGGIAGHHLLAGMTACLLLLSVNISQLTNSLTPRAAISHGCLVIQPHHCCTEVQMTSNTGPVCFASLSTGLRRNRVLPGRDQVFKVGSGYNTQHRLEHLQVCMNS